MSHETITIDGHELDFREEESILHAARRVGIEVPTLCFVDGLAPDGGCRLCVVEVEGESRPHAACHTPVEAGMRVRTGTAPLETLRRAVLSLLLSRHSSGTFRPDLQGCAFEALLARYGVEESSYGHPVVSRASKDATHPYLRFDASRCIVCRRCLHACDEIQGQFVYDIAGRGGDAHLALGASDRYLDSDCTSCGACVEVCPTGAISDVDRQESGAATETRSTCAYCGVGCGVSIESSATRVLRIRGATDASVNRGHLCAKGRYAHAYQRSKERLTTPLRREGDRFEPVSWEEAIAWLAGRLSEIQRRHGGNAIGALTSSRSTNEAAYLLQKLIRTRFASNHVDCCARVCHSSTALALGAQTGAGAASASYADIERARFLVIAGANPTEAHPIVGARIKQAALNGAGLLVIDPRRIELCDYASQHLALRPGTNVALQNGLAKLLLEEGAVDAAYLAERVEGLDELRAHLSRISLDDVPRVTGIDLPDLRRAARQIGAGPVLFVHGLGLSELTQGTDSVATLCNLGLLTGSIGRPGAGMLPLRGQNNVQGSADMGSMPNAVTGYQALGDPAVRERLSAIWGAVPPATPGWTLPEMLDRAVRGELRALWIQGEDIVQSDPSESHVIEALQALDLVVVQELFFSETARFAHLVLPAAGALEQEGTFTNAERRIQRVRPAVKAPGEARADWSVIRDVAVALGERWSYESPSEIMDEVARVAPALFGGVCYEGLEPDGLQWPCPTRDHPGTQTLHADGFLRGKGRLVPLEFVPSPEHDQKDFPYLLTTGRVLQHYNVGTMTRRTANQELEPIDRLEVALGDAERLGLVDGDRVEIESRWGRTTAQAYRSERIARGRLFLSFHHPKTHTNRLTGPLRDPQSNCPDYKVIAVRLRT